MRVVAITDIQTEKNWNSGAALEQTAEIITWWSGEGFKLF